MTRDDVIRLAREAGITRTPYETLAVIELQDLDRFASLVMEECAGICEVTGQQLAEEYGAGCECIETGERSAAAIRAAKPKG